MRDIHVMPVRDVQEHDEKRNCWCEPRVEYPNPLTRRAVVVHNSADGRELIERHGIN